MDYILRPKLENFFKQYFTQKDLKINVFDEIKLTNVSLNAENINKKLHTLPFELIKGDIGSLVLSAPLASFWNNPSYLSLKDVNLHFQITDANVAIEFNKVKIIKDNLKQYFSFLHEEIEQSKLKHQQNYTESLIQKIVDNIQIDFNNVSVSIRMKNPTQPEETYEVKVSLNSFIIKSVDEKGNFRYYDRQNPKFKNEKIRKKIELQNFQISTKISRKRKKHEV